MKILLSLLVVSSVFFLGYAAYVDAHTKNAKNLLELSMMLNIA